MIMPTFGNRLMIGKEIPGFNNPNKKILKSSTKRLNVNLKMRISKSVGSFKSVFFRVEKTPNELTLN